MRFLPSWKPSWPARTFATASDTPHLLLRFIGGKRSGGEGGDCSRSARLGIEGIRPPPRLRHQRRYGSSLHRWRGAETAVALLLRAGPPALDPDLVAGRVLCSGVLSRLACAYRCDNRHRSSRRLWLRYRSVAAHRNLKRRAKCSLCCRGRNASSAGSGCHKAGCWRQTPGVAGNDCRCFACAGGGRVEVSREYFANSGG